MPTISESIFMRAIRRMPVERTPVWLMRQAGRYLPEYRQTRINAGSFMNLCQNKTFACEVAMQPLRRFDLDAAILFSDILTIPDAMGLGLSFVEGEGPRFAKRLRDVSHLEALPVLDVTRDLSYVMDAVQLIRQEMPTHLPLIGFAGSPWTLACYMIEGESSREFKRALSWMYLYPEAMQAFLTQLALTVSDYLIAQVMAGANAVMLFDTWGGLLTTHHYQTFSLQPMRLIVNQLKQSVPDVPVILFTKGGGQWIQAIADTGCQAVGIDWTCDISHARLQVGHQVALQGNLDPTVLLTSEACIRREVQRVMNDYGTGPGLIFNLGHGITPDVPPQHVKILVDAVHENRVC